MKRAGAALAVVLLAAAVTAISVHGQDSSQSGAAGTAARAPHEAMQGDVRNFVDAMAIAGMAEVRLGNLAAQRAASADVKAFGQMMVKDHAKANDELKQVASRLKVEPTAQLDRKHQDLADRLSRLNGAAFDREYIAAMIQGHQDVLTQLQAQTRNRPTTGSEAARTGGPGANEQGLTQWAAKTLPVVQQHLARAQQLQQQLGK